MKDFGISGSAEATGGTVGKTTKQVSGVVKGLLGLSIFLGIVSIGLNIYYIYALEETKKSISIASNKPAGEFATEPNASVSSGVLNECTYSGLKNQPCIYRAQNLNEAIAQCNRLPQICNRFVYNSESKSISIISLDSNNFIPSQNSSVHTRQVGVTYSGTGQNNNANSGGFSNSTTFTASGQDFTTAGAAGRTSTFAGAPAVSYY
jgi:hypothetical protein